LSMLPKSFTLKKMTALTEISVDGDHLKVRVTDHTTNEEVIPLVTLSKGLFTSTDGYKVGSSVDRVYIDSS